MRFFLSWVCLFVFSGFSLPLHAAESELPWVPAILQLLNHRAAQPTAAACSGEPPPEGPVTNGYRSYAYAPPNPVSSIDVSLRGWRTVAGTDGSGLYFFSRDRAEPIVHALDQASIFDVDMNRDGSVTAASDDEGRIYLFECDAEQPSWSYATAPDDEKRFPEVEVELSDDGLWLAAASDYHLYLFRRNSSTPILKLKLSENERLSTLALAGDGSRLAVATEFGQAADDLRVATVFLLDQHGLRWQHQVTSKDSECTANISFLPLGISQDGGSLVTGGCDDQIRFWDTASSSPIWTVQVGDGEMITALALAADGDSLAVTGETIHYIRDTTTRPDFSSSANWTFNYWLTYRQPTVYGALDSWQSPWNGLIGRPPISSLQSLSISEDGHYIFSGATGVSYLLHRDDNEVTRLFGTLQGDVGQYFDAAAISPEASWVATGSIYGNEILRFEVAPMQKISTDLPLTVTFPDNSADVTDFFDHFGVDSYTISYQVLKPGRAADLKQDWSLWGFDGTMFVSPTSDLLCRGDAEWSWTLNLADGNIESSGTREIEPPQCLASSVSAISEFDLFADLEPDPVPSGGVANFFTDSVPLMKIQVGNGP